MIARFYFFMLMLLIIAVPKNSWALEIAESLQYPFSNGTYEQYNAFGTQQSYMHWNAGWGGYHLAYDVGSPTGTKVYASADGTVVESQDHPHGGYGSACGASGYLVLIESQLTDGTPFTIIYGHVRSGSYSESTETGLVPEGTVVRKGQYIATIADYPGDNNEDGVCGDGNWDHLHWGIRVASYNTVESIRGYGSSEGYWDDPVDFIEDHQTVETSSSTHLMTVEPNSSGKFDLYGYEVSGSGESTELSGNYFSYTNTGSTNTILTWLAGDVDGDTWDDVVQVRTKSGYTYAQVYLSNGEGGLYTQSRWKKTTGIANHAFLDDLDGDGTADLMLTFANTNQTLTWKYFLSTGDGFDDAVTWHTGFGTTTSVLLVGDFNGNGEAEAFSGSGSNLNWQRLSSSGSVNNLSTSWGLYTDDFVVADINDDGYDELVRIDERDSSVEIEAAQYYHTSGTLGSYAMGTDVGGTDGDYVIFSLDYLDGYADLIRSNGTSLYLARNNGGLSFEEQTNQSELVTGLSLDDDDATILFGDFGIRTSTTLQSIDGDEEDPEDDDDWTDPEDQYLFIDTDQNGVMDPCLRRADLILCDENRDGDSDYAFSYGDGISATYFPLRFGVAVVYNYGTFYLDEDADGYTNRTITFGGSGDSGHYLGNGGALGIQRSTRYFLIDNNSDGYEEWYYPFGWGLSNQHYYLTDMNGDNLTDLVFREGNLFTVDLSQDGSDDFYFTYGWGDADDYYFADLISDGTDEVIVRRGDTFYVLLNESISRTCPSCSNAHDFSFSYGNGL